MKVLIKGCASDHDIFTKLQEWADDEVLVWGLNDQRKQSWWQGHDGWNPNHTLEWFQLHGLGHMVEAHGEDYLVWLSGLDCRLYMFREQVARWATFVNQELKIDIPLPEYTVPFPVNDAVQMAGRKYITNSFGYQTALAVLLGATHIHITGVTLGEDTRQLWKSRQLAANFIDDFMSGASIEQYTEDDINLMLKDLRGEGVGEESWIIPNLEFWLGIARGRGCEVTIDGAHLFHDKWGGLYGYEAGGHI